MEYIMAKEHANRLNVISEIQDENKRKQLRMEDDEEDFLDESMNLEWVPTINIRKNMDVRKNCRNHLKTEQCGFP